MSLPKDRVASRRSVLQRLSAIGLMSPLPSATRASQALFEAEPVFDPAVPVVDPHHHLWDGVAPAGAPRYLAPDLVRDLDSGHRVIATVFVECGSRYRKDGPEPLRPVGETGFVVEESALDPRIAHGIVGHANLMLGDRVDAVLEAHIAAGAGRFRGVRQSSAWDADPSMRITDPLAATRLDDPRFRAGFARLAALGLSFDAWGFHTNLAQIGRLAAAFPDTRVILDHAGSPLGIASNTGRHDELFDDWRAALRPLARLQNVTLKFGGLGMAFGGPALVAAAAAARRGSHALASVWQPWFDACLDLFGPNRIMFESNFPVDRPNADYRTTWNAFKRLAAPLSADERLAVLNRTAVRTYRLAPATDPVPSSP